MAPITLREQGPTCDCCEPEAQDVRPGFWSALLPVVACAVCPACLATYTKLLSLVGVSVGFGEGLHHLLLVVALVLSMSVSGWRSWRTGRAWPLLIAAAGSALVSGGHLFGEHQAIEWAGVLVLLAGGSSEHFRLRRRAASPDLARSPAL